MRDRVARYRFVVFDWDGTLVDSTGIIAGAIQAACEDVGCPRPDDAAARYVIGLGLADAIRHVAPGLAEDRYRALSERYRHHYLSREPAIPLFEGAALLLDRMRGRGLRLGIATGKTRKGLDRALAATGLGDRFDATRCADEGRPKPHPDMLLHLIDAVGVSPRETLMVGDTSHDVLLARNAGADAVAITHGAHEREALSRAGALALFDSLDELGGWLLRG